MYRRNFVVSFALMSLALGCNGGSSVELPEPDLSSGDLFGGDMGAEVVPDDAPAPDAGGDAPPDTPLYPDGVDVTPACEPGDGCVGDPCQESKDCLSGWCVDHLGGMVCTDTCVEDCPAGWSCNQVGTDPDTTFICVSDYPNLCAPCATGADCTSGLGTQSPCVDYGAEGSFCGGACGEDGDCPDGFACLEKEVVSGATLMQCVSNTGTCECTDKSIALGLSTPCSTESEFGTCEGIRVCTDDGLSACDAGDPVAEICNGLDDDCDEDIDEETCDDENPCTDDICNGADGCEHVALDGVECPDGDLCTVSDICEQGTCVGTPMDCGDGNVCTDDICDPDTGDCVYTYNTLDCDDDDPCTVADECQLGVCVGVAIDCDCVSDEDCGKFEDGDLCNGTLYCDTTMSPHLCKVDQDTFIECPDPEGPDAPCLAPACDPETGECGVAEDNEGFPCDDEDLCTVADYCEKGECLGGAAANCNDGNVCTDDSCEPATGCILTPNTVPCEDGDICTVGDQCEGGECVHGPEISCDDGNVCTDDACDPAVGCVFTPNEALCDDQNLCTETGVCAAGACTPGKPLDCNDENVCTDDSCAPALGCVFTPNTLPCTDGNACTLGDICAGGSCVGDVVIGCDDGNPCTDDSCDPVGGCVHTDNLAGCSDGNACTLNDECFGGICQPGAAMDCNDGNPCTDDACHLQQGCFHTANSQPCSDGNACTLNDVCDGGTCQAGAMMDCDDGSVCTDDSCDPQLGCVNAPNTAPCNDNNACTFNDVCASGFCQPGTPVDCVDGNVCTTDSCTPTGGCANLANTAPCIDGNACTLGDLCADSTCQGGATLNCDDGNPCTDDSCDPASGCVHVNNTVPCDDQNTCTTGDVCADGTCVGVGSLDCDDGNPCTKDICLPGGGCDHEDIAGSCTDGDPCTLNDSCQAGICVPGPALNCDDGNPCTDDVCDQGGSCFHTNNTDACDDGNACTTGDVCSDGSCVHAGLLDCNDGDICTTDSCNPVSGCVSTNNTAPCDDGDACTWGDQCSGGACQSAGNLICDDGNVCTDDSCDEDAGCVYTPNTGSCDDGNACTDGDSCAAGICLPGAAVNCNDGDVCTTDSCNPTSGCVNTNNTNPCMDNNLCTTVDTCSGGVCVGSGTLTCNDGNVCTTDTCAPATGCAFSNNTASCDDGNACTSTDTCSVGTCVGSGTLDCNDGDPCTDDSCNPTSGCVNSTIYPCCGNNVVEGGEECDDGNQTSGDGCDANCQDESPVGTCSAPAVLISAAPSGSVILCDDPTNSTCEQDFGNLCPAGWHLCGREEFNNRNAGWTHPYSGTKGLGTIHCRGGSGAGHFTLYYDGGITTFGQDSSFNCGYGSSRPQCPASYGCNEKQHWALCCSPGPLCGNGVVDSPEETCDDGNSSEDDSCLNNCVLRSPGC